MRSHPLLATVGGAALTLMLVVATGTGAGVAKPRPPQPAAPAETADEVEARMVRQIMASQPVGLQLHGDVLGWVKRCGGEPSVCTVSRGFSLDPAVAPTMKTTITTTSTNGTHVVAVAVPLDQDLKSGFAVRGDQNDAALGTYTRCSLIGCAGDVVLTDASYDALAASTKMDVIIKDISGRTVMYEAPLEGLDAAIKGPALSDEDFVKAMQAAGERMVTIFQARVEAARAAEEAGAATARQAAAGAAPAAVGAAPPAGATPATPSEPPKQ